MNYKKWLFSGILVFVGSSLIGTAGTFWGVYATFDAAEKAEITGMAPVVSATESALAFTVGGIAGSVVGILIIIVGGVKAYRKSKADTISPTD